MLAYEQEAQQQGYGCIAGIDEVGRGPLAGPVVAAACILPVDFDIEGINDSKQLTPLQRERCYQRLTEDSRVCVGWGQVEAPIIDAINIYQATIQAMLQAVAALPCQPDLLLVDGLLLPHPFLPVWKIIKGDAKSASIAAASILAKVHRDRLMIQYHESWPHYGFDRHKGYGTREHCAQLVARGPCPLHRRSFEPVKSLAKRCVE